ncbi:hypothetical protein EW026_g5175 [Hermanssonia centrifuga]|uniref:MYND-type zinc finger protein samB n=1 Tax=Hermanssonia centrifuga TaxID=98765 RepID=A0A4S4KJ90_9APHY|nr:hypothetical protein EW026_g5175 [Hermanssonia centrifuga]
MANEPLGALSAYDDMWSWDLKAEKWQRQRIVGNPPCPRTEGGCTYNEKLSKTIVFAGFSPTLPTNFVETNNSFNFSYYADTFICEDSPKGLKWKQVLTRGFPTYRAQSNLFSDPATGRTFTFGGYTNSEYVPDGKHIDSRRFGDLWELKLDVPGGHFEGVDFAEEAKAGPWQRCFTCGSAGPWKRCAGSCRGRVFFCDTECQKDGWKEHKEKHKCAKT